MQTVKLFLLITAVLSVSTATMYAAHVSDAALAAAQAAPNTQYEEINHPMVVAAREGKLETVRAYARELNTIIDSAFKLAEAYRSFSPNRYDAIVGLLREEAEKGRKTNAACPENALCRGVEAYNLEIVKQELEKIKKIRSATLIQALEFQDIKLAEYLLEEERISPRNQGRDSKGRKQWPVILAIQLQATNLTRKLVDQQAFLQIRDDFQNTPLMWAAYFGNLELVTYLREVGADLNGRNKKNETAIYIAAVKGHFDVVGKLLAEFTLDVSARSQEGYSVFDILVAQQQNALAIIVAGMNPVRELHPVAQESTQERSLFGAQANVPSPVHSQERSSPILMSLRESNSLLNSPLDGLRVFASSSSSSSAVIPALKPLQYGKGLPSSAKKQKTEEKDT